ncbi:MAG: serine hydrolase domain-containing protein [bacterium]
MKNPLQIFNLKSSLLIIVLIISMISNLDAQTNYDKVKNAVDSVKAGYEAKVNRKIPSLNILINTPYDMIFISSVTPGETPLTKDTYFRFASNTKNFTSAAILDMQQRGMLNIKDKITDLIPKSNSPYVPVSPEFDIPYKNEITIELLLQHAAGVYDIDNDPVPGFGGLSYTDYMTFQNPAHQFELSELVNQVAKNKLSYFPPGMGYHYSNTGYTILSEIIQRVSSLEMYNPMGVPQKYADYIYSNITGAGTKVPLDIRFPYLATDTKLTVPYATGYLITPDSTAVYTNVNMSAHVGEGNGYATFSELNRYVRTMMKGENVLSAESISLMQNTVSDSNKTYGLGCINIKSLGYGHNGCIKGYLSYMLYDPADDISVIIMMPENDYTDPGELGLIYGLKALVNTGFASKRALGYYSGGLIPY